MNKNVTNTKHYAENDFYQILETNNNNNKKKEWKYMTTWNLYWQQQNKNKKESEQQLEGSQNREIGSTGPD